jgi:protein-L-isoaspartate(D-aspartate) O-methyltransferase
MYGLLNIWIFLYIFFSGLYAAALSADDFTMQRKQMVQLIEADVKTTSLYLDKDTLDPQVMQAIATVPRHEFVPEDVQSSAYLNRPLPIGHGQTISQPYIVAIMTDLLKVKAKSKVLELGTGSGYQAAVLSRLVNKVFTIEIIEPLGLMAKKRLAALGYDNVEVKIGDGYYGWQEHAPFDAIVVTAAANHIPPPLIKQLKKGGKMMIPVGTPFMTQQLLLVNKQQDGKIVTQQILPVRFVPVTGKH